MPALRILVSEQVHGTSRFEEVLLRHHGAQAAESAINVLDEGCVTPSSPEVVTSGWEYRN